MNNNNIRLFWPDPHSDNLEMAYTSHRRLQKKKDTSWKHWDCIVLASSMTSQTYAINWETKSSWLASFIWTSYSGMVSGISVRCRNAVGFGPWWLHWTAFSKLSLVNRAFVFWPDNCKSAALSSHHLLYSTCLSKPFLRSFALPRGMKWNLRSCINQNDILKTLIRLHIWHS